jgi:hypothetical protein
MCRFALVLAIGMWMALASSAPAAPGQPDLQLSVTVEIFQISPTDVQCTVRNISYAPSPYISSPPYPLLHKPNSNFYAPFRMSAVQDVSQYARDISVARMEACL